VLPVIEDFPMRLPALLLTAFRCSFTAKHGEQIGWRPQYPAKHILEAADDEVELILTNLKS
jgi:hypothetical protein